MSADGAEEALLTAARGGDREALTALLHRHQAQIYRFSRAMCRDVADAEDVLQDTMLALARGVTGIRGPSVSTWLYAVARSACARRRRRSRHAPSALLPLDEARDQAEDPRPGPEESLDAARLDAALHEAIHGLAPMYREVLALRDVEGLSAAEVAATLNLSEAAVKSRLHRARVQVRDRLAPLLGPAPAPRAPGCPDVATLLSKKLEGQVSARTCAELEAHLASCAPCRGACDTLREALALCRSSASPEVPEQVQRAVARAVQNFLSAA